MTAGCFRSRGWNMRDQEKLRTLRSERSTQHARRSKRLHGRVAALLVFGAVAVLIAKQEIPVVDSWFSRLTDEQGWQAAEQCRAAARSSTGQAEFVRQLKAGKSERTEGGYYISGVVLAVLDDSGEEQLWRFSCNVSAGGEVVAINADTRNTGRKPQRDSGEAAVNAIRDL